MRNPKTPWQPTWRVQCRRAGSYCATAELALDRDGNFLAVRLTGFGNLGATYGAPGPPTRNAVRNTLGVYKTPLIEVSTKCAFTNTTPVGAYRGAGRPEANY